MQMRWRLQKLDAKWFRYGENLPKPHRLGYATNVILQTRTRFERIAQEQGRVSESCWIDGVRIVRPQWALSDPSQAEAWVKLFPEGDLKIRAVKEIENLSRQPGLE